jgi:hypothetical protein
MESGSTKLGTVLFVVDANRSVYPLPELAVTGDSLRRTYIGGASALIVEDTRRRYEVRHKDPADVQPTSICFALRSIARTASVGTDSPA